MAVHITVKELYKYYGNKAAIKNLNFNIERGEIVGFLGPNGAGKSTTLRILCGLLSATSGSVYIRNQPLTRYGQRLKRHLGYMPENNPLPDDMRVEEFLRFRAQLKRVDNVTQAVGSVMECCDLKRTAANKIIRTLSKGFRQRVGIADALLGQPQLIILDEPTIGLDPHQIIGIRNILKQIQGETTVIFSSHILPEIEAACTQLLIMHQGELVADGTYEILRQNYFRQARYKLVLDGFHDDFLNFLSNPEFDLICLRQTGNEFILQSKRVPNADFEVNFLRILFERNYRVQRFSKIEPNLEALFLKLTKFAWKDEQNKA